MVSGDGENDVPLFEAAASAPSDPPVVCRCPCGGAGEAVWS